MAIHPDFFPFLSILQVKLYLCLVIKNKQMCKSEKKNVFSTLIFLGRMPAMIGLHFQTAQK